MPSQILRGTSDRSSFRFSANRWSACSIPGLLGIAVLATSINRLRWFRRPSRTCGLPATSSIPRRATSCCRRARGGPAGRTSRGVRSSLCLPWPAGHLGSSRNSNWLGANHATVDLPAVSAVPGRLHLDRRFIRRCCSGRRRRYGDRQRNPYHASACRTSKRRVPQLQRSRQGWRLSRNADMPGLQRDWQGWQCPQVLVAGRLF